MVRSSLFVALSSIVFALAVGGCASNPAGPSAAGQRIASSGVYCPSADHQLRHAEDYRPASIPATSVAAQSSSGALASRGHGEGVGSH